MMIRPSGEEHLADTCRSWFAPGDPIALATTRTSMMAGPVAAAMGCRALDRVRRFTASVVVGRVENRYERLISAGRRVSDRRQCTRSCIDRHADRGSQPDDPPGSGSTGGLRWKTRSTAGSKMTASHEAATAHPMQRPVMPQ
jgi:hypothetical protein